MYSPDGTYGGGLPFENCLCKSGYAVFNWPVVGIVYTTVVFVFSMLFATGKYENYGNCVIKLSKKKLPALLDVFL